jgi:hypothetical protein
MARHLVDCERIGRFMTALGAETHSGVRVYFTGGVTAVLLGWRESTIDIDLKVVPDADEVLRAIPRLKEELRVNVELASPAEFVPELSGWQDRSLFIAREGRADFFHYDLYSQALAKIERGHALDRVDVREMLRRGLVEPPRVRSYFAEMEPKLYRYPAIDPSAFGRALDEALEI